MESPEHQEQRSRERVRPKAVVKAALLTGFVLFVMSGGGPWTTAGTMNAIMGRRVDTNILILALGHFAVAFIYMWVVAQAVYRWKLWTALGVGVAVGVALYLPNVLIFRGLGVPENTYEGRVVFVHLVYGLFGSALYKAFSVPRPMKDDAAPAR